MAKDRIMKNETSLFNTEEETLGRLSMFSKPRVSSPSPNLDPVYYHPKSKNVISVKDITTPKSYSWLTERIAEQTKLGCLEGKTAIASKIYGKKATKISTSPLTTFTEDSLEASPSSFSPNP